MNELENLANTINDSDGQWWPFLFLRPPPEESLTSLRVALLAALFGIFAGTLGSLLLLLLGKHVHPFLLPAIATGGFFILQRFVFAACWNRRAERLRRREQNRGRWGRR